MKTLGFADVLELTLELALVVVTSLVTVALIGLGAYIAVSGVIAVLLLGVFVANGLQAVLADRPADPLWFVGTLLIAMVLGAFWPLGPVVLGYHRVKLILVREDDEDAP